ncbi:hypothetical protein VTI28DRAFT_10074 [Corynascus sepedonium]
MAALAPCRTSTLRPFNRPGAVLKVGARSRRPAIPCAASAPARTCSCMPNLQDGCTMHGARESPIAIRFRPSTVGAATTAADPLAAPRNRATGAGEQMRRLSGRKGQRVLSMAFHGADGVIQYNRVLSWFSSSRCPDRGFLLSPDFSGIISS